nr:zinc finger BED domain-containing protein RICESLEEPER 2 [Tanacetum cinerariifolium]
MASMNTRLSIEKLDGNIVQKHRGSKLGAQGDHKTKVFQVGNDDTAVAQRRLEDKQPEEKTNTDCLVEPLGDHTFEVERQKNDDQGAGLQEVQTQDLMDYQLARDREHLACELFGYREDTSADVGMLDKFDRGLQTDVQVFVDFDYAWEDRSLSWVDNSQESRYELRLVACIATGALIKGCSRSEVPAHVKVAAYCKTRKGRQLLDSNSTLKNHISHPHCEALKRVAESGQSSMSRDGSIFVYNLDVLREQFTGLVIQRGLPFNHFDDEQTIRVFLKHLQPKYNHAKETMFPVLSRMVMDILSVQATSVAFEFAFLASERVLSIRRTRVTPASLEMYMCLKDHLDAQERKQDKSTFETPVDFEEEILDAEVQENEVIPLSDEEIALDVASSESFMPGYGSGGEEDANYGYDVYHDDY